MHLSVVLGHAERAGVDAVAAVEAARFQCRKDDAIFSGLDRVSWTNQRTRGLRAVHTDGGHGGSCF